MDSSTELKGGYRVIGHNTSDGLLSCWCWTTLEMANAFAKQLCEDTGQAVEVTKAVGRWQPITLPVEFIAAPDDAA